MRILIALAPVVLVFGLAACASTATGTSRYSDELRQLESDCHARGGILAPSGQQTGRPQTDNICKISGGGSRLPPG